MKIELKNMIAEVEADNGILRFEGENRATFMKGITGYVDDGTFFRLTFTNGIITAVSNSIAGGHS